MSHFGVNEFHRFLLSPETSILEAIRRIDSSSVQIALVTNGEGHLLGTVTDGDVRRGLLRGVRVEDPVSAVMNKKPVTASSGADRDKLLATMAEFGIRQIPLLDVAGRFAGLETLDHLIHGQTRENVVVLMAGGEGRRLRPLTAAMPKPMLRLGDKPLLETILESFVGAGFRRFYISVNYKAELVESHFRDGRDWNVNIEYLRESKPLGTAGALHLLPEAPTQPILVMNGDLLTKVSFPNLVDFHAQGRAAATICVRDYNLTVPYGVVEMTNSHVAALEEKPQQRHLVNAGIYVLEPSALNLVPPNERFDMPDLLSRLIQTGTGVTAFPIREYWMDIGQMSDFERASQDYTNLFR